MAHFDDAQLMAYAGGELDLKTAGELELAATQDKALAKRLASFQQTRTLAKQAIDQHLSEPVPVAMEANILAMLAAANAKEAAALETATPPAIVTPANDNRRKNWFELAVAASVALVAGGFLGFGLSQNNDVALINQIAIAHLNDSQLSQLLGSAPSGEARTMENGARFKVIATFNNSENATCREFEIDGQDAKTLVSVVCHNGKNWDLQFAVAAGQGDQGYAPASSLELLDSYYNASGAGTVLSLEAEKAALEKLNQ